jgi:hypothetical protein
MVYRETKTHSGFDGDRRGHSPGTQKYPVRIDLPHLAPLSGLLAARIGHRNLNILETTTT